jgi:hypothetical protein
VNDVQLATQLTDIDYCNLTRDVISCGVNIAATRTTEVNQELRLLRLGRLMSKVNTEPQGPSGVPAGAVAEVPFINPLQEVIRRLDPSNHMNVSLTQVIGDLNRTAGSSVVSNQYPQEAVAKDLPLGHNDTYLTIDPNYKPNATLKEVERDFQKWVGQLRQENPQYGDMRVSIAQRDNQRYLVIDAP